jgi:hypothetical protein
MRQHAEVLSNDSNVLCKGEVRNTVGAPLQATCAISTCACAAVAKPSTPGADGATLGHFDAAE